MYMARPGSGARLGVGLLRPAPAWTPGLVGRLLPALGGLWCPQPCSSAWPPPAAFPHRPLSAGLEEGGPLHCPRGLGQRLEHAPQG